MNEYKGNAKGTPKGAQLTQEMAPIKQTRLKENYKNTNMQKSIEKHEI